MQCILGFVFWSDIMSIDYKLKTKRLLQGNVTKLFVIKLTSLILRYGTILSSSALIVYVVKSSFFKGLKESYGVFPVSLAFYVMCATVVSLCVLFFFGVLLGENMCFFEKATGKPVSLKMLFSYMGAYTCSQALFLYAKIFICKLLWLLLFSTPCLVCVFCLQLLLSQNIISGALYYILSGAMSIVFSASLIMWRISTLRYSVAPYIFCLDPQKNIDIAINQSISCTDEFLLECISNDMHLFFKSLWCMFILPIPYTTMYIRLSRVVFMTDAIATDLKLLRLCQDID